MAPSHGAGSCHFGPGGRLDEARPETLPRPSGRPRSPRGDAGRTESGGPRTNVTAGSSPSTLRRLLRLSGEGGGAVSRGELPLVAVPHGNRSLAQAGERGAAGGGPADYDQSQCQAAKTRRY